MFMHVSLSSRHTKVELNRKYRMHDIITQQTVATSMFINARSVFMRKVLQKGRYVIIPTTFKPDTLGEFMLRVYTEEDAGCRYSTHYSYFTLGSHCASQVSSHDVSAELL